MNAQSQRFCAWCGPAQMVIFLIGFWAVARFMPPLSPTLDPDHAAAVFRDHSLAIRIGMLITFYAGALSVPWVAAITVQLKRVEGGVHTPLAYTQLGLGCLLPLEFIVSLYFFATAAFRADRDPKIVQVLMDLGWLPLTGLVYTVVIQAIVIGAAILMDKRDEPIFPRWSGYFNIMCGLLMSPAGFDLFFKTGPLAWNGLIAWWLLVFVYFVWVIGNIVLVLKAIRLQEIQSDEAARAGEAATVG
jgi:hypothetical protein